MFKRPYLDANVWINFLMGPTSNEPAHRFPVGEQIFRDADMGNLTIVASTLLYAEVAKAAPGGAQVEVAAIDKLMLNKAVDWVELDLFIARAARQFVRDCNVTPSDAVHVATAIRAGADVFMSWDKDKLIDRIQGVGIVAELPHWEGQIALDVAAPANALPLEPGA